MPFAEAPTISFSVDEEVQSWLVAEAEENAFFGGDRAPLENGFT